MGKEFGVNSEKMTQRNNGGQFNKNDLRQIVKKFDESDAVQKKKLYATQNNSGKNAVKTVGGPKRIDLTFQPSVHSYQRGMSQPPHLKAINHGN